jgi:hypothetical protein
MSNSASLPWSSWVVGVAVAHHRLIVVAAALYRRSRAGVV